MSNVERLQKCPDCGKLKMYWNTREHVGYCHYCQKGFFDKERQQDLGGFFSTATPKQVIEVVEKFVEPETHSMRMLKELRLHNCDVGRMKRLPEIINDRIGFNLTHHSTKRVIEARMGRTLIDAQPKWMFEGAGVKSMFHYQPREIAPSTKVLVLVEGIFDACTVGMLSHWGIVPIGVLGTVISDSVAAWLSGLGLKIAVWFDPDAAGVKGSHKVANKIRSFGAKVTRFDFLKEPNDCSELEVSENLYSIYETWPWGAV